MSTPLGLMMGCFFGFQTLVHAATFFTQPFPKTVSEAGVIVRGKIGASHAEWGKDADDTPRLYTYYELQAGEVLKGETSQNQNWMIRELGGTKEGVEMHIPGTAQFSPGEDVVVFLKNRNAEGTFDLHGMMMGKFNVKTDSNGVEYLDGPAFASDASASSWTLDGVRTEIAKQKQSAAEGSPPPQPPQNLTTGNKVAGTRAAERNLASTTQPLVPSWFGTGVSVLILAFGIERIFRKKLTKLLKK